LYDEDGEDYKDEVTHRFVLSCQKSDLRYIQLLSAISKGLGASISYFKRLSSKWVRYIFCNLTKKIIFHMYDDRGCDVIASDKEDIRFLYQKCNGWILDYDREKIESLFKEY
jgi:hypothetical protein